MFSKILPAILAVFCLTMAIRHVVKASAPPPKSDPIIEPTKRPFKCAVAGAGVIEPRSENISIGSHLPGVVVKVFVQVNDEVSVGSPLFQLDDRNLQAELAVRKANYESAMSQVVRLEQSPRLNEIPPLEARVREAKANLDMTRDLARRAGDLIKSRSIGEEELYTRRTNVATSEAQLARAEADLELLRRQIESVWKNDILVAKRNADQAKRMVEQTETEIKRLTVRSPIQGRVLQKNIREGEYVGVPATQTLMVLGDLSKLHIRMDIDESDIPRYRSDLAGVASPRGDASRKVKLKFVRIEPFMTPKKGLTGAGSERVDTRVLQVIYEIDEAESKLYVGQQLDVYLDVSR